MEAEQNRFCAAMDLVRLRKTEIPATNNTNEKKSQTTNTQLTN